MSTTPEMVRMQQLEDENQRLRRHNQILQTEIRQRPLPFARPNPGNIAWLNGEITRLRNEKGTLQTENRSLTIQMETFQQASEAAGKDAKAKKAISDILKLASDALLASTTAEDNARAAEADAKKFVEVANAAATNAKNSDFGSAAALAAENAAQEAKKALIKVAEEVNKVKTASSAVEKLAKTFFADPSKVADSNKAKLTTDTGSLNTLLSALSTALGKVQTASTEATKQAEIAMNVHDNWETLGPLFGFTPPSAKGAGGKVEKKPSPTTGAGSDSGAFTIDNWGLIQQKFGIPKMAAVSSSKPAGDATSKKSDSSTASNKARSRATSNKSSSSTASP